MSTLECEIWTRQRLTKGLRITVDLAIVPSVIVRSDSNVCAFSGDVVDLLLDHVEVGGIEVAIDGVRGETFQLDIQTEGIEPLGYECVILFGKVNPPLRSMEHWFSLLY